MLRHRQQVCCGPEIRQCFCMSWPQLFLWASISILQTTCVSSLVHSIHHCYAFHFPLPWGSLISASTSIRLFDYSFHCHWKKNNHQHCSTCYNCLFSSLPFCSFLAYCQTHENFSIIAFNQLLRSVRISFTFLCFILPYGETKQSQELGLSCLLNEIENYSSMFWTVRRI